MSNTSTSLSKIALQKYKKNFWGVFSFSFLALCILAAVFAYLLAPDNSKNANQMHLSIHSKAPGFSVAMLILPSGITSSQNLVEDIFLGKENTETALPIKN